MKNKWLEIQFKVVSEGQSNRSESVPNEYIVCYVPEVCLPDGVDVVGVGAEWSSEWGRTAATCAVCSVANVYVCGKQDTANGCELAIGKMDGKIRSPGPIASDLRMERGAYPI
jgi:hypothetical protein